MKTVRKPLVHRGGSALLISVPHAGTDVPASLREQLSARGRVLPDTDWYVDRLYGWAASAGAGMLVAPFSRYVIDLNRPPDDAPLYDFSGTGLGIGLAPVTTFGGEPVYREGCEPDAAEISERMKTFWEPYHRCLRNELKRIRDLHGHAIVLDAHSIRSTSPLLFDGILPDLNLGSFDGKSASASLLAAARRSLNDAAYSLVVDGRFKGGYITRHYGNPGDDIHALQLEMTQSCYMQEDPPAWRDDLARPMQGLLKGLVQALMDWKPGHA